MENKVKNFAVIGVGGYIAPRHLQAIKATGNNLIAATDPHDAVGILDRYFFDVPYFKEFERFDRYIEMLRYKDPNHKLDYVSICSPNYLHDAHVRFALRSGANAICEKPLVLNPWNCDMLMDLENESKGKVYNVLQLRLHPAVIELRNKFQAMKKDKKFEINLHYITSRGKWYLYSWKGDIAQSGGLASNIGIHFFDMLIWIFGKVEKNEVFISEPTKVCGHLELETANVNWFLSVDKNDLPEEAVKNGKTTFRSMKVDGIEAEFSEGFTDLHTKVYEDILSGGGFRIADCKPAVEVAHAIRSANPLGREAMPAGLKKMLGI